MLKKQRLAAMEGKRHDAKPPYSRKGREPTRSDYALAEFADSCEAAGFKPSHYYRLTEQIMEARAVIAAAKA